MRDNSELLVRIKHSLKWSLSAGNYDFWTFIVPKIVGDSNADVHDLMKLVAQKAVSLLKKSTSEKKRVDIFINFENETWEIVRIIGTTWAIVEGKIPIEDEIFAALASALIERELNRAKVVIATLEIFGREHGYLTITMDSKVGSSIQNEMADALSGETIILTPAFNHRYAPI